MAASAFKVERAQGRASWRAGAYVGISGYAAILACAKQRTTAAQAAEKTGTTQKLTKLVLKQLHALRLVHRVDWVRPSGRGFDQPVYLIGDGEDVPARLTEGGTPMPHADHKPTLKPKIVSFGLIVQALGEPRDLSELVHETGLNRATVRDAIKRMHAVGLCYVHERRRRHDGAGPFAKVWHYGIDRPDARRPPLVDQRERDRVRRQLRHGQWGSVVITLKRLAGYQLPRFDGRSAHSANAEDLALQQSA